MGLRQNPQAAWRVLEGHAFIVPHGATGVVELDEVATFIWCFVEAEHTLDEIVAAVCQEFNVEPDRARGDCQTFLDDMMHRALVLANTP